MDWTLIETNYRDLLKSVYPQPDSEGHTVDAQKAIEWFLSKADIRSVADMGCSTGFCAPMFEKRGIEYTGVTLGQDYDTAVALGRNVLPIDFNFLPCDFPKVDAVFSRHSLEHSPFPHLTLLGWKRVVRKYMMIVLPALEWFHAGRRGTNHFSVLNQEQWQACFDTVGLQIVDKFTTYHAGHPDEYRPSDRTKYEYWFLLSL